MKKIGYATRSEFRAVVVIATLLILATILPGIYDKVLRPDMKYHSELSISTYTDGAREVSEEPKSTYVKPQAYRKYQYNQRDQKQERDFDWDKPGFRSGERSKRKDVPIVCKPFDPNTVSRDDLLGMGLPGNVANNIVNYRAAGASFNKPEDMLRLYAMDSSLFAEIKQCIAIEGVVTSTGSHRREDFIRKRDDVTIGINGATPEEWQWLRGIGPHYAGQIVKYRKQLGGFISVEQVAETPGLPEETFEVIRHRLIVDSGIQALDLNHSDLADISNHPYISHKQAQTIVNFRNHHGPYAQIEDVMQIHSLSKEWFERVSPYLDCRAELAIGTGLVERRD